jgi:hypothetical protein
MWRYRRHIIIIVAVVLGVLLITVFTDTSRSAGTAPISKLLGGLVVLALLATATLVLSKASKIADTLEESDAKLDKIAETLEKNRSVLNQVNQSARLRQDS